MADTRADAAVVIGRYQPFHNGHLVLLREALALGEWCVVVLGSIQESRTSRNPFTWEERAEMIAGALSEAERGRLVLLPMRDLFDEPRWADEVQRSVASLLTERGVEAPASVVLVGHAKDPSSGYLWAFPDWRLVDAELQAGLHATDIRELYFGGPPEEALAAVEPLVPASTLRVLRRWAPDRDVLAGD